jgi:hypothetical protein
MKRDAGRACYEHWQMAASVGYDKLEMASTESTRSQVSSRRQLLWFAIPGLALVLLHVLVALTRDRPLIFADEAGYIGNARYLAGGLPIKMFKAGAYYPGYSLLVAPLFWLGLTPAQTYQAILICNGVFLSTAYVSLVFWMKWILGYASRYSYAIAFATSLYPAFLVQPGFAMSESAAIAFATALPLLVFWLVNGKSTLAGVTFAASTAFLYAIHPRFVGSVGLAFVGLGALAALRTIRLRTALISWVVLGGGVAAAKALTAYVTAANKGGSFDGGDRIATLMTGPGIWSLTLEALGQFWYLEVASAGFILIGVVAMAKLLLKPAWLEGRRGSPAWTALLFATTAAVLAFGVSCAFMSEPHRVDHFIYGRYNEGVVAPFIATGIWAVFQFGRSRRAHLAGVAMVAGGVLATAVILYWARGEAWSDHANLANILGLIPLMKLVSGLKLVSISLVALGGYVLFSLAASWRPWLAIALLNVGFLVGSWFSHRTFLSMQRGRATRQVLFDRAASMPGLDNISYDEAYFDPVTLFFGQYFLPHAEFDFFNSAEGEAPKSNYVLGNEKWPEASSRSMELLGRDKWGYSLWTAKTCCDSNEVSFKPFGFKPVAGIAEEGFYGTEAWPLGPVRWTNGNATLRVSVPHEDLPTSDLLVDVASVGPAANRVVISANGRDLFNGKLARGRSRLVLPLATVPVDPVLEIKIESKTFVPTEGAESGDKRELGVAIRAIRMIRECCLNESSPFESGADR